MATMLKLPTSIKSSPLFPSLSSSSHSIFLCKPTRITGNFISFGRTLNFSTIVASLKDHHGIQDSPFRGGESFFRNVLGAMETVYLNKNPTARAILELVRSVEDDRICYDHLAFRTFGVNNHGIDSMAKFFSEFGYVQREELRFPAKKLKAFWFSPPNNIHSSAGTGVYGPLPRIFISELLVDQMSPETQKIIRKYTESSGNGVSHAALASALGSLTWNKPSYSEFQILSRESEYAAWTLVNGYTLNHVTISTHRLKSHLRTIGSLNQFIEENGFKLNSEGGVLKVSPDGLLLQSSTVADSSPFQFSDGIMESVPCSYIEFAERLVLPQFKDLPENKVEEFHRRDGFEVGNADKIFESTSKDQLTRKVA
ncbi:2-oxoadipate dioxygenase/decarboxylase, chloroplastic/amyloplastic-like [Primulina tabacum]|uniref:2-oxoadipate dioxygenase/decarboxylase, chloroplastic/amyloplastic-like n=1 Tax=Primulina tabacum TaxID=48773 RepID=UPI003F5A83DE